MTRDERLAQLAAARAKKKEYARPASAARLAQLATARQRLNEIRKQRVGEIPPLVVLWQNNN